MPCDDGLEVATWPLAEAFRDEMKEQKVCVSCLTSVSSAKVLSREVSGQLPASYSSASEAARAPLC